MLNLELPGTPPSVNHYKKPNFRTRRTYVTDDAQKFFYDLAVVAAGRSVEGKRYRVAISIFLGKKQKGDIDNFAKVVLDGLVHAHVIKSDAHVDELFMSKARDIKNPRTVITVGAIEPGTTRARYPEAVKT